MMVSSPQNNQLAQQAKPSFRISREQLIRGTKIASAGVIAGSVFALTGGLAAPGIAAGVAALTASVPATAAAAAVVSTLTSTVAVTTVFGVGGGGLAAYKMQRRTKGLTEFTFQRENPAPAPLAVRGPPPRNEREMGRERTRMMRLQAMIRAHGQPGQQGGGGGGGEAELFSSVCLSGWLRDSKDFQRPWGVQPTNPPIADRLELLERFYSIVQPDKVSRCGRILYHWRGEERQLWRLLRHKYGRDPDRLLPFGDMDGPRHAAELNHEEHGVVDRLLIELGYDAGEEENDDEEEHQEEQSKGSRFGRMGRAMANRLAGGGSGSGQRVQAPSGQPQAVQAQSADARLRQRQMMQQEQQQGAHSVASEAGNSDSPRERLNKNLRAESMPTSAASVSSSQDPRSASPTNREQQQIQQQQAQQQQGQQQAGAPSPANAAASGDKGDAASAASDLPRHLSTVWDYHSRYGGELYTVKWESDLLLELCDSVTDMAVDILGAGTKELLKQTVLAGIITAIAIPYALTQLANSIDSSWTLAVERSDEAGVELAKSLLESQAGHRPVTLVAYSMGARTVYACLKELARHQELWEDAREERRLRRARQRKKDREAAMAQQGQGGKGQQGGKGSAASGRRGKNNAADSDDDLPPTQNKDGTPGLSYAREPASIVEDVIVMGMPNHLSAQSWVACRRIVSGRLVHCYSRKDLILSLMFQYKRLTRAFLPVCGTCPIDVPGVENYDVTELVSSHADYCLMVGDVLELVRHGQPRPRRPRVAVAPGAAQAAAVAAEATDGKTEAEGSGEGGGAANAGAMAAGGEQGDGKNGEQGANGVLTPLADEMNIFAEDKKK